MSCRLAVTVVCIACAACGDDGEGGGRGGSGDGGTGGERSSGDSGGGGRGEGGRDDAGEGGEGGEAPGPEVICGEERPARCIEYMEQQCELCNTDGCTESQECFAAGQCDLHYDECPAYFECWISASSCDDGQAACAAAACEGSSSSRGG